MFGRCFKLVSAFVLAGLVVIFVATGCGDDKPKVEIQSPNQMMNGADQGDFNKKLDELKKAEMTVEVIQNGDSSGKWSQNSSGSWRWEDANDTTSYVIYNADKKKTWVVNDDTAIESTDTSQSQSYAGFNPALMMSSFAAMTYMPHTGGSDDTWEWEIPGTGKLTIEFKGPNGLVTRVIDEDSSTKKTDTTEFVYSNVGSVSSSLFELPSNITVTTMDNYSTGGMSGSSTNMMPGGAGDGSSTDAMGGYSSGGGLYGGDTSP